MGLLRYRTRLMAHMRHESYEPAHVARLVTDLKIDDPKAFAAAIDELAADGFITIDDRGRVDLPSLAAFGGELIGVFSLHPKGFGFVRPDRDIQERSLFISPDDTMDAMSGDLVRATIQRSRRGSSGPRGRSSKEFRGRIVEILERKSTAFTGVIHRQGKQWLVKLDARGVDEPVIIRDAESKNVRDGDKVVIEMTLFPEGDMLGEGVITDVLGEAGEPDVETAAIIAAYNLPGEFPNECVDQARDVTRRFDEEIDAFEQNGADSLTLRRDLTEEYICTIDPPDAKDYDDAISISRDGDGWRLGVHIADVGHFIDQETALDIEGKKRGNSVYLPRLVIPMLPEILSNGICSLQEGVLRYCKSLFMRYDRNGNCTARGAASTLIRSRKRLTYLEAQALIDGNEEEAKKHARTEPAYTDELLSVLKQMNALARAIQKRRHEQGMISLELPDAELVFNDEGRVIDAVPEDDAFTHTLIEMFMVEANETAAVIFGDLSVPVLRRVHPEPTPGDVDDLRTTANVAGYKIPKSPTREELQGLLDATRGRPAARAVHMAVLRTLTRAEYSPALIGHFALASEAYSHFTSPIRRYPDLVTHRSLGEYLRMTDNGSKPPKGDAEERKLGRDLRDSDLCPHDQDLMIIGRHCSNTENNAEDAERALRQFLVLQLLEEKIGETFQGVVTGVNPRGVFVQIDKYLVDGFIQASDLPGDVTRSNARPNWKVDRKSGGLVDQSSGRSFKMGDMVSVTIAKVDLAARQLDLQISDPESRATGKAKMPKLDLGGAAGGLDTGKGAGFKTTGAQKRSRRSKSRDKGKTDYRKKKK